MLWVTSLSNYPAFTRDFWNDSILAYILIHLHHHQKSKASGWLTLYSSAQPLFWSRLWLSLALLSPRGHELPSVTSSIYSLSSLRCSLHLFCSKGNLTAAENTAAASVGAFLLPLHTSGSGKHPPYSALPSRVEPHRYPPCFPRLLLPSVPTADPLKQVSSAYILKS